MHTVEATRGHGIGHAMVEHLLHPRGRAYQRVSLETGSMDAFAPARSLYEHFGFAPCRPFGDYTDSPHSTFMTLLLD